MLDSGPDTGDGRTGDGESQPGLFPVPDAPARDESGTPPQVNAAARDQPVGDRDAAGTPPDAPAVSRDDSGTSPQVAAAPGEPAGDPDESGTPSQVDAAAPDKHAGDRDAAGTPPDAPKVGHDDSGTPPQVDAAVQDALPGDRDESGTPPDAPKISPDLPDTPPPVEPAAPGASGNGPAAPHVDPVATEIAAEQVHVDKVHARVEVLLRNADEITREGLARGRTGHHGGLVERDAFVHVAARRRNLLNREHEGLVFGRLDFDDRTVHHIGRLGVLDENYEPLVLDWRAPVAAPFYRATPEERLEVVRRRVIRCTGARVVSVDDDLLDPDGELDGLTVVGDGALIASLSRARTGQMRDIVATIQAHQDEAIRAPSDGVTLISGGPGTGKTVVALHRAAYLLYRDRKKLETSGVLVVGPSPTFMRYIERVLPSLGEDSASLRSVGDVVDGISASRNDEPELAAIKGSARMAPVLGRAVRYIPPSAPTSFRLLYRGGLLELGGPQLRSLRRSIMRGRRKYNRSLRSAMDQLSEQLYRQTAPSVQRDRSLVEFREDLGQRNEYGEFVREWWPMRTPVDVLQSLGDQRFLAACSAGTLKREEIALLAADWEKQAGLSVQDVALLDEIRDALGEIPPPPPPRDEFDLAEVHELWTASDREFATAGPRVRPDNYTGYGHVILDEAQDLSPMQWRMLGRRGQFASWTIVGDGAQSSWPDPAEARASMLEALGNARRREYHLDTNYRSPAEVFALAADVVRAAVPDADLPTAVRSTGREPQHHLVSASALAQTTVDVVEQTLDDVEGAVAVICSQARRDEVAGWVSGLGSDRVSVIDELQAKGLEYDGVIVVEPDEIAPAGDARGVRLLYVVLTRATQVLVTVAMSDQWLPRSR